MGTPLLSVTPRVSKFDTLPLLPNINLNKSVANFIEVTNFHELEVDKMYLIKIRINKRYDIIAKYKNYYDNKFYFTKLYERTAKDIYGKRGLWMPKFQEVLVIDSLHSYGYKIYILPIDEELLQRVSLNDYNEILKNQRYDVMA